MNAYSKSKKEIIKDYSKRAFHTAINIERLPFYFILAFVLELVIECFARRSLAEGLLFPFQHFIPFLANYLIILTTLLPVLFLKRRIACITLISAIWMALCVTQFVLLSFRVTPLTAVDFTILANVITIIDIYLSPFQIILIVSLILAAITAIVFLFIKMPKAVRAVKKCAITLAATVAAAVLVFVTGFHVNALSDSFPNLSDAYDNYGFAYCFSLSIFDRGIDHPTEYSKETIDKIMGEIEAGSFEEDETKPNIIFVQLESLFDVNRLKDITFSENPLPNLTKLKNTYFSGAFTVPVIGAGTVNTEFEVLSGMSVNHFGPGEYPYRSLFRDKTCETIAYTLAESGYTAHALHNHQATFYSRDKVYQNLGFSSFTPLEYMLAPEYNDTLWAKDSVLIPEIFSTMESTENQDFVFAVSVQGHGKYPTDYTALAGDVYVTGGLDDPAKISQYNYYLKQIHEMDAFVGALTEAVLQYDEPCVLVFYGDHLPSLSIENEMLADGNIYQTEYLILSNYDLPYVEQPGDLHAYELYPTVMELIGNSDGILNRFHRVFGDDEDFLEKLKLLEYDLLYGEHYATGGENPYLPMEDMTFGTRPILLESYEIIENTLYVYGENFTPYSVVLLDEHTKETVFIDNNTLSVDLGIFDDEFSRIAVQQRTQKGEGLTETESLPGNAPQKAESYDEEAQE